MELDPTLVSEKVAPIIKTSSYGDKSYFEAWEQSSRMLCLNELNKDDDG